MLQSNSVPVTVGFAAKIKIKLIIAVNLAIVICILLVVKAAI